jgi:hypothetical protein
MHLANFFIKYLILWVKTRKRNLKKIARKTKHIKKIKNEDIHQALLLPLLLNPKKKKNKRNKRKCLIPDPGNKQSSMKIIKISKSHKYRTLKKNSPFNKFKKIM